MKTIKDILDGQKNELLVRPKVYRFQVFMLDEHYKKKTIGMAYLRDGQSIYSLRLWTFMQEKFFLIPSREDAFKYLVLTRQLNRGDIIKNKYFWNIVGNGSVDSSQTKLDINFDLLSKTISMNLLPESSTSPNGRSIPSDVFNAA